MCLGDLKGDLRPLLSIFGETSLKDLVFAGVRITIGMEAFGSSNFGKEILLFLALFLPFI